MLGSHMSSGGLQGAGVWAGSVAAELEDRPSTHLHPRLKGSCVLTCQP